MSDDIKYLIDVINSDIYRRAKSVMLSCERIDQFEISNKYIELCKKKYIKGFTNDKRYFNIDDISIMFDLLKYFKIIN